MNKIGFTFATNHVKDWNHPTTDACDVVVLAKPGLSRERVAAALDKLAGYVLRHNNPPSESRNTTTEKTHNDATPDALRRAKRSSGAAVG